MHNERMKTLLWVLLNPIPHHFDMEWWHYNDGICGTSACAAGSYILIAKPKGLYLTETDAPFSVVYDDVCSEADEIDPAGALCRHFDITPEQASSIFEPGSYWQEMESARYVRTEKRPKITPGQVVSRILEIFPELLPQASAA